MEPHLELLGSYGINKDYEYQERGTGLRILKELNPPINLNLTEGFEGNNKTNDELHNHRDKFGNTLRWLVGHKEHVIGGNDSSKPFNIDILCGNGLFPWIFESPFESKTHEFVASKYKGLIFVRRVDEPKLRSKSIFGEHASFAGNKFRELMTKKVNHDDDGERHFNIVRAKFRDHTLLYSCKVDCVDSHVKGNPRIDDFVELIPTKSIMYSKIPDRYNCLFKEIKSRQWWSSAVMSGTMQFVIGVKNDDNEDIRVRRVTKMTLQEIIKAGEGYWSPSTAMSFLDEFLNKVKEEVAEDNPDIVHLFTVEGCVIKHEKLVETSDDKYIVLTESMIEQIDQVSNH